MTYNRTLTHTPRRFSYRAELVRESLPRRRDGWFCFLRCVCTNGAYQVPRASDDGKTCDLVVDSKGDMDERRT